MKTVFSGIQPSGNLHLGNYLGSISNWLNMPNEHRYLFGIMDLHAITLPQDPKQLSQNILDCAITYLACGLDPKKSIIFVQSTVQEHAELSWILGCLTPMGWLNRMTQFKEKSANEENLGLYSYPVLMAADILLYKANLVPTGEDQKQHLELVRDLAGAFNRRFSIDYFKLPDPLIFGNCTRVMSLIDGSKKMSKSEISDLSRINLSDSPELITKKIKKSKTDSIIGVSYDKNRPEIHNLLNIFSSCVSKKPEDLALEYQFANIVKFKEDLAEALIFKLKPIQKNIADLKKNLDYVKKTLQDGESSARNIASSNLKEIRKIIGLV